ncbi:MAG: LysM domain-containing protein, partial [Anaerolineales bacterium]|nr:LysM domain-containing protein [Anaerolineales bacterium]
PHLDTMLGSSSTEIGAGVATAGEFVYYTIDVGYVAESPGTAAGPTDPDGSTNPGGGGAVPGVSVAAPAVDGSISHEVQAGETLIGVAVAYGITVEAIQELNELGLTTFIYPGDKLLIQPAYTPTPTATATVTATPPRPTRRPPPTATRTPTPPPVVAQLEPPSQDVGGEAFSVDSLVANLEEETDRGTLILGILGVAFLLLIVPVLLGLRKKER